MRRGIFFVVIAFALGVLFNISWSFNSHELSNNLHESLIRFHVIANSDSDEDQKLKLKVRNIILDKIEPELEKAATLEEAREYISNNLFLLEELAQDEINKIGYNYPTVAILGKTDYPTRAYGDIIMPAGTYESLRIIIGEGKGSNWWCVLFPPLCFIDITHSIVQNKAMPVMGMDEEKDTHKKPVQIKFKFIEIIKDKLK